MDSSKENSSKQIKSLVDKMEGVLKDRAGKKISYPYFIGLIIATAVIIQFSLYLRNPLIVLGIVLFTGFSFFIANVHLLREKGKIFKYLNKGIKYLIPIDEQKIKSGPTSVLRYIYMLTFGGTIFILIYSFTNLNAFLATWMIPRFELIPFYGIFSYMYVSGSIMPFLFFTIMLICPIIFCCFFLWAAVTYTDKSRAYWSLLILPLPFLLLLPYPLQFYADFIFTGFISVMFNIAQTAIVFNLFLISWSVTLSLWFRLNKRSAFICVGIFLLQVISSTFIFYTDLSFTIIQIYFPGNIFLSIDLIVLLIAWFFVMITIPIGLKIADHVFKKRKIFVALFIIAITIFLYIYEYFTFLVSLSVFGISNQSQVMLGIGFFYFYLYLIQIPIWFLFGYYQLYALRGIYRFHLKYGPKVIPRLKEKIPQAARWTAFSLWIGWIVFYFFAWKPIAQGSPIAGFPQSILSALTFYSGFLFDAVFFFSFELIDLFIFIYITASYLLINSLFVFGLLTYSTYRSAHNLSRESEDRPDQDKLFVSFVKPGNYKSRILLGFGIIVIFLGLMALYSFVNLYLYDFLPLTFNIDIFLSTSLMMSVYLLIDSIGFLVTAVGFAYGSYFFLKEIFGKEKK